MRKTNWGNPVPEALCKGQNLWGWLKKIITMGQHRIVR
jgi:hypothetical protein